MKHNWTYKKLGDLVIFDKRFQGVDRELQRSILSFTHVSAEELRAMETSEGDVRLLSTGSYDGYTTEEIAGSYLSEGEVITIPTGGAPNIKYYKGKFVDSGNILLSAKDESVLLKFVHYALLSNMPLLERSFRGASIKHPQMAEIWKIILPLPSLDEQQAIVRELDGINRLIDLQEEQLREYDRLAQSLFSTTFGDPATNPNGWEVKKYGDIFEISSGGTPSKKVSSYWNNGNIPWIGSNMCQNCVIYETDGKYITQEGLEHSSAKLLPKNTVLVALVGATIGKVGLLRTESSTNQNIAFIKPHKDFAAYFVYFHLMNQYDEFMNIGNGDFKMATQGFIKGLGIMCPPLALQQSFATQIEAIEQQKALVRKSLEDTRTLLAARMQYYFE